MMNKMAARVFTYELGSPSYSNLKLKKWFMKTIISGILSMVCGKRAFSVAAKNGTILSSN